MTVLGAVLIRLGVTVAAASAVAATMLRPLVPRLHALTPVTMLAGPLVGGLAVVAGWTSTTATVLPITTLLAATGPVLGAVTARLTSEIDIGEDT